MKQEEQEDRKSLWRVGSFSGKQGRNDRFFFFPHLEFNRVIQAHRPLFRVVKWNGHFSKLSK